MTTTRPTPPAPARLALRRVLASQAMLTAGTLLVVMALFTALFPGKFATLYNLQTLMVDYSGIVLLGVGLTFIMTSARFDLSVGAVLVFSCVLGTKAMGALGGADGGWGAVLIGLIVCLGTGLLAGLVNGFLIVKARVPSIIVTLGTLSVAQGAAYVLTGGVDLYAVPKVMLDHIGQGKVLGLPVPIVVAALAVAVGSFVLSQTRFGQYTCATGSNAEAARRAGINIDRVAITLYLISGAGAGLAGFMSLARYGSTTLAAHQNDNLTALLGVVLGGTSLFGGTGTVVGTAVGVFIPGVLSNGLVMMQVLPYWQYIIVGIVLIAVVYIDLVKRRGRTEGG
ncbi:MULTISPECIES: ABC transporter permease [Deinococcus]|uniref:Ribose transport system permease protein n=2 Tax=Deinococcus soli (ex Cha et al. 2016) TaxID=1309411 RepID=A0AAE3XB62_9DEIO|nr:MULTISPECIES: ABC transporter permease [Deinococcus]MDK2012157.1 ABC transporter permease [Deinococcus sp. 43]MDR6218021.1 ribose transport system permease protein [Deinococcus soli (ex Cha et al. 2016)]MDR6328271.1 ribose transport system permease protein [Deinococcus soli (ex Cha et al. 2016)]MDR6751123.1 ribose transport system permease protein [Deinococcus soli (ex Cha et al. 2016)]